MKIWQTISLIVAFFSSLGFISSCGDSSLDISAGGGIGGTGYVSSGTITAFGSVVVNGVTFATTEAKVFISGKEKGTGQQAILNYLDLGQVVLVEGTADESTGIANHVRYTPHVVGPVTAIDPIGMRLRRFTVLGQTIIANSNTIVKPGALEAIEENNLIEVSGLVDDEGMIKATYIRKLASSFDPATEVEVKGSVQNLDLINKTFQIKELTIFYNQANLINLTEEAPLDGQWVHVRGRMERNNCVVASEIQPAPESRITNAEWANLEAFITDFISEDDFGVGLVRVKIHENARFEGGAKQNLRKGLKIRVKGRVVNKILLAQYIWIFQ